MTRILFSGLVGLWALLATTGCDFLSKLGGSSAGVTGSAGPAGSASAPGSALPVPLTTFPEKTVPAGTVVNDGWTPEFSIERSAGNEGLTLDRAVAACRGQGKDLCTETQWTRACAADSTLGALETWTLSVEAEAGVVRGGAGGCSARQNVRPADTSPTRVAVCCSRAVAIHTDHKNEAFLVASAKRLLDYERATQNRDATALGNLFDEAVLWSGAEKSREDLLAAIQAQSKDDFAAVDRCDVSIDKTGPESCLVSDCRVTTYANGTFGSTLRRFVHGGPESRLQLVGAPDTMSLLKREKKQRLRSFIGGE
ncbi:MAG: hypothetical protein JW751_12275 [Polyangiaceae bacterium]|nr:hypothetical protein [Polyangiaceae bacterium]